MLRSLEYNFPTSAWKAISRCRSTLYWNVAAFKDCCVSAGRRWLKASSECILQGTKRRWKSDGVKSGRYDGWGFYSTFCLAENFRFVVLTSLKSALIPLNSLSHLSSGIPLTTFRLCSGRWQAMTLLAEVHLETGSLSLPTGQS
jgi:hypothetical protein